MGFPWFSMVSHGFLVNNISGLGAHPLSRPPVEPSALRRSGGGLCWAAGRAALGGEDDGGGLRAIGVPGIPGRDEDGLGIMGLSH